MAELLFLLAGGLIAGLLGGLLGIGGGIILMPLLRFGLDLPPAAAAGTCIVAVFFTTVGGAQRHLRQGHLRPASVLPVLLTGAAASAICSFAFGCLARRGHWLDLGIGLVFCLVSARMIVTARGSLGQGRAPRVGGAAEVGGPLGLKVAIGAVAGALPGLLGIGTGGILVPAFTFLLRAPVKTAMAASLTCYTVTAAISAAFKLGQGHVVLAAALPLGLGALLGANLGARLNGRFSSGAVRLAFGLAFIFVSLKFIASFFQGVIT